MLIIESEYFVFYLAIAESKPYPCQSTGSKYIVLTSAGACTSFYISVIYY